MQRQGEVICLPAICRSSQRVDLQREGEPFDSSPLIASAAALRGKRAYTRGKRGFDLSRTADETLWRRDALRFERQRADCQGAEPTESLPNL